MHPALAQLPKPELSCFICANYRSGSTLLAVALKQLGISGKPSEHLAPPIMEKNIEAWGIKQNHYPAYLRAAITRNTTPNNVYGVKIMYPDMAFVVGKLRKLNKDEDTKEINLLSQVFPNMRLFYIYRRDKIRQGISLYKMHLKGTNRPYEFDLEAIDIRIEERLIRYELEWQAFFKRNNIEPFQIIYEDFVETYKETIEQILDHLQIPEAERVDIGAPPLKREADTLTEEWVQRYRDEGGWLADPDVGDFVDRGEYGLALARRLDTVRTQYEGQKRVGPFVKRDGSV